MSARIGVFGGTFDPPHVGHLVTAIEVRERLALDVVLLVVANDPWQKSTTRTVTPALDRLALVRAAVAEVDGLEASDVEIRRGGASYTVDTLAELARQHPGAELFCILGSDAAAGVVTWDRAEELVGRCRVVVVDRPGARTEPLLPPGLAAEWVDAPRLEVSSTDLRDRLATGRSLRFLVSDAVISEVAARGLYRGGR